MEETTGTAPRLSLSPHALQIEGQPVILLCASLFYFRIPRGHWRERMEQLKRFGYNAIDVYFPWNYHETEEGKWDFEGEKDAAAFLQLASESGLWVIARPGPYICSEWDGGALPAYLLAKPGIKLRSAEEQFLDYTAKWYDRIMPVLKAYQPEQGGTLLCVQLDNELDFYGCPDPLGYMSALRDMALARGITVPLLACAGQGGVREASGLAEGVVPACNFYPNDRDPEFEGKVLRYKDLLGGMGLPLLVTETNRSHYLLRRLVSCGAKLIGPYLQVSGTDFGFTNATNNWGRPLAFMTSDYDFGGMISPEGHVRAEAYEGRLLSRLIRVYGEALSRAVPDPAGEAPVAEGQIAVQRLNLEGGGYLSFITNLVKGEVEVPEALLGAQGAQTGILLPEGRSVALPVHIPLRLWGLGGGELAYSTAELFHVAYETSRTLLFFHTESEGTGELAFRFMGPAVSLHAEGIATHQEGDLHSFIFHGDQGGIVQLQLAEERLVDIVVVNRAAALLLEEEEGEPFYRIADPVQYPCTPADLTVEWSLAPIDAHVPMGDIERQISQPYARFLEECGIYRGYAWYTAKMNMPLGRKCQGYIVRQGSDVISLYADKDYVGTVVPGGGSRFIPTEGSNGSCTLTARTEIWGHSNFDDIRLPALRLNACKGLKGLVSVAKVTDLSNHWRLQRMAEGASSPAEAAASDQDDPLWPTIGFGGWMSPDHPAKEIYRRTLLAMPEADTRVLHFEGLQAMVHLFVNGEDAGVINPFDPYADITAYVEPGQQVQIAVYMERRLGLPAGSVMLYEGMAAEDYRVCAMEEPQLAAHAALSAGQRAADAAELPITLEAGAMAWFHGQLDGSNNGQGWRMRVEGTALKLTVLLNGRIVGRLWLPGSEPRPVVCGGDPESVYLPGALV